MLGDEIDHSSTRSPCRRHSAPYADGRSRPVPWGREERGKQGSLNRPIVAAPMITAGARACERAANGCDSS